jgi:hypothetical protein
VARYLPPLVFPPSPRARWAAHLCRVRPARDVHFPPHWARVSPSRSSRWPSQDARDACGAAASRVDGPAADQVWMGVGFLWPPPSADRTPACCVRVSTPARPDPDPARRVAPTPAAGAGGLVPGSAVGIRCALHGRPDRIRGAPAQPQELAGSTVQIPRPSHAARIGRARVEPLVSPDLWRHPAICRRRATSCAIRRASPDQRARRGVYFVTGNHEHYSGVENGGSTCLIGVHRCATSGRGRALLDLRNRRSHRHAGSQRGGASARRWFWRTSPGSLPRPRARACRSRSPARI